MRSVLSMVLLLAIVSGGAQQCFNGIQNESMCSMARGMSMLPPEVIQTMITGMSNRLESLFVNVPKEILQLITETVSMCPIKTDNDWNIAKVFQFTIFSPNGEKPRKLSGSEFMRFCRKESSFDKNIDYTIFLWPGWLDKCSKPVGFESTDWTQSNAQELSNQANAQVIDIDWGKSGLSCCNYLELVFCHLEHITKWMGDRMIESSKNSFTAPIERMWMIGHSLGVHFCGYTIDHIFTETNKKLYHFIAMDAAGPMFSGDGTVGRCQSIHIENVQNSTAIYTNPKILGIGNFDMAKVKILSHSKNDFCQPGCPNCDPLCCHSYAPAQIFRKLIKKTEIFAKYLSGNGEPIRNVTIFEQMENGFYDLAAEHNPGVLEAY